MLPNWDHNEGRAPSMRDVNEILTKLRPASTSNKPVMALNQRKTMLAQNNGFPMHLYHETLEPVVALTEEQAEELYRLGYQQEWIGHRFPKYLFRRNFDIKYALKRDPATQNPINHEYVEERLIRNADHEKAVLTEPKRSGTGPWCERITDIEPLPDNVGEAAEVRIARLEGQIEGLKEAPQAAAPTPRRRGRPRKAEQTEEAAVTA